MMRNKILSLLLILALLSAPALALSCPLCGGDGVCDTCGGNGYQLMQAYGSTETIKVACAAGCDDGKCPDCQTCEVCGGLGYLTMQAYGSGDTVKVACTAKDCSAGAAAQPAVKPDPGLPPEEVVAPEGTMLLVSPAEYADGKVTLDEDSSSWMYTTTGSFDMDGYLDRLCEEYDMSLTRTNEVGSCIFYDLDYRHIGTGSRHTLSLYTFTSTGKVKLTVIKPSAGGISLPEFSDVQTEKPAPEAKKPFVSDSTIMLPSPSDYTDGRVFTNESSTSWQYSTTKTFDMDAYIDCLVDEYGMTLKRTNVIDASVFYDLSYTHPQTGGKHTLSVYTFSGGEKFQLTVIKPSSGGIALPEFTGEQVLATVDPQDVPDSLILIPSPVGYTDGKVYLDESSSSWEYSTTEDFDMDAYIKRICRDCDMELDDTSVTGSCVFYDLIYMHPETGKRCVLCMYTFTGSNDVDLTIIKPSNGGIALPEFYGQEAVTAKTTAAPKSTPKPTEKPKSDNKFENAMDAYLKNH